MKKMVGQGNLLAKLKNRETNGRRFNTSIIPTERTFQKLSDVLPDQQDRMGVVLLGFSYDGDNIIGYRDDNLILWRIDSPKNITLTDSDTHSDSLSSRRSLSRPWLRVPFPELTQRNEDDEDSQVELEVLQSVTASLLVLFSSTFNPCETDRGAAITLVSTVTGNNRTIVFPNVFMGVDTENRYLVDLQNKKHVLVLNCGDIIRFIQIETSSFQHSTSGLENKLNTSGTCETCEEVGEEFFFPSRIQTLNPNCEWWCSSPSLDYTTSSLQMNDNSTVSNSNQIPLIGQTSFEVEIFLSTLLATQLKKLDGIIADYHVLIVDPYFKSPTGKELILVAMVVKISRRFNQVTYVKRPRGGSLSCLIGVSIAIDPCSGKVAVIKTVHLKPPSSTSSNKMSSSSSDFNMLKRLTQHFASTLKPMTFPHGNKKGKRLSNVAVLKSKPIAMLTNPVLPIGIRL